MILRHIPLSLAFVAFATGSVSAQSPDVSALVASPLGMRIDSTVRAAAERGFSGVALVAKDGKVILTRGYGLSNRALNVPMTASSVVQIGSNTKDFTAVAILQLMEQGKLALTDSLPKFFRNVRAEKRPITVQQLLTHRAGFPQHIGGDFDPISRDEMLAEAFISPLLFAPGERNSYSNTGYAVLAAIIETLSGKSYDEYVRDNIFALVGMKDTGYLLPGFDPRRVAHGYSDGVDRGAINEKPHAPDGPYWHLRGNGGMLSTVGDMHNFYEALYGDKLLKPASREIMFRKDQPIALAGSDMVNHFIYSRDPMVGVVIILASNAAAVPAPRVMGQVAAVMGIGGPGGPIVEIDDGGRGGRGGRGGGGRAGAAAGAPTKPFVMPATAVGRRAAQQLAIFNAGDTASMRRFSTDSTVRNPNDTRTIDQRLASFRQMRGNIGTLTPLSVESSDETHLVIVARAGSDEEVTLIYEVEAAAPYRLLSLRIEAR